MATRRFGFGAFRYPVLFFLTFFSLYALYYHFLGSEFLQQYFTWLACSVSSVISFFDSSVGCQGTMIYFEGSPSLAVGTGCDGLAFIILFFAGMVPFSRTLKVKIISLLILIPLLIAINWLRILMLALIRFYSQENFDFFHLHLFQPIMVFLSAIIFFSWIIISARNNQ